MRNLRDLIQNDKYDQGGWCFDFKREFIHNLVTQTQSKFCVEIGVYKGSSLFSFAEVLEPINGKVVGIDPWSFEMLKNKIETHDPSFEKYFYDELMKGQETMDNIFRGVCEIIEVNQLHHLVTIVRKPSEEAFIDFEMDSIDVLHIDGNHNEKNCSRDILLYLPLVKKGGYIIMDDSDWKGVRKSIEKFLLPSCELIEDHRNFSCYKKR